MRSRFDILLCVVAFLEISGRRWAAFQVPSALKIGSISVPTARFTARLASSCKVIWRAVSVDTNVTAGDFTFALL
jgi:hypothetical protein